MDGKSLQGLEKATGRLTGQHPPCTMLAPAAVHACYFNYYSISLFLSNMGAENNHNIKGTYQLKE